MSNEVYEIPEVLQLINAEEKVLAKHLGDKIGYGRMMQLAQEGWREVLEKQGIEGGEFAYGPCVAMTVPCECDPEEEHCDWCCGAGWLTEHVKQIKEDQQF